MRLRKKNSRRAQALVSWIRRQRLAVVAMAERIRRAGRVRGTALTPAYGCFGRQAAGDREAGRAAGGSGSHFLKPSGTDHYGPSVDWADVPPWQQTSFFFIRARGRVFV
jgi:hypothetical protein